MQNIQSNIWKYTVLMITNKRVFGAILPVYFLTINGVQDVHLGWILFIGSLLSFLFEIPSGFLSDKIGHRKTIILAYLLFFLSTLFYLISTNLIMLIVGWSCFVLAQCCLSGTSNAFMHDTLKALGRDDEFSKITGKANSLGFGIPIVLMIVCPFLVKYSYDIPFIISLVIDFIGLCVAFSLVQVEHSQEHKKEVKETKFLTIIKQKESLQFLPFACLAGLISGYVFSLQTFRPPFQEFAGADVALFGVFFGAGRFVASAILAYSDKIKSYFTIYGFYKFNIVVYLLMTIALGLIESWYSVVIIFIFMNGLQWGLSQANTHFLLEKIAGSKFKATLLSVSGQMNQAAIAITALITGYLVNIYSYYNAFLILAVIFAIACVALYLNTLKVKNAK